MRFINPQNGHEQKVAGVTSWLWCLLFQGIYWGVKGVWRHFFLSLFVWLPLVVVLAIFGGFADAATGGTSGLTVFALILAWSVQIGYSVLTYSIIRKHYLRLGWREVKKEGNDI